MKKHFPRMFAVVVASASVVSAGAYGCSSHEPSGDTKADSGSSEASGRDPNANCVKPGTPNNEQGIGGYCETNADCVSGKSLCTGLFGAPPDAWFCTRPCKDDPNCGDGLYCANDSRGIACVPIICGIADSGSDAPADVGLDAPADVELDAPADAALDAD